MFSLKDYSYILPEELIAQEAIHPHHDAKLMVIDRESGAIDSEAIFWNLDTILESDRVIFFNNSKVLRSRVPLSQVSYTRNDSTEGVLQEGEIFFLKTQGENQFEALVRPGNKFKIGTRFVFHDATITVINTTESGRLLQIEGYSIFELMERYGNLPLPPYIAYDREKEDDYQTSFAKKEGSVAAPTASLHFTQELLGKIKNPKYYTTLHVGLGTFKGIDTEDVRSYKIHEEQAEVDFSTFEMLANEKRKNQKIVAVGTTVCRTLESLPSLWKKLTSETKTLFSEDVQDFWENLSNQIENNEWIHAISVQSQKQSITFFTSIYIVPGHNFLVVDELITNFHLPESSLLVLVSALLGNTETISIYKKAIEKKYRFYSFGDGMYIRGK